MSTLCPPDILTSRSSRPSKDAIEQQVSTDDEHEAFTPPNNCPPTDPTRRRPRPSSSLSHLERDRNDSEHPDDVTETETETEEPWLQSSSISESRDRSHERDMVRRAAAVSHRRLALAWLRTKMGSRVDRGTRGSIDTGNKVVWACMRKFPVAPTRKNREQTTTTAATDEGYSHSRERHARPASKV